MKTTSAEHGQNMFCACSFHGNSMNNLLSYCGLIDEKIRGSEKDLPVMVIPRYTNIDVVQRKQQLNIY